MQVKIPLSAYGHKSIIAAIQIALVEHASDIIAAKLKSESAGVAVSDFRVFSDRVEIAGYSLLFEDVDGWDLIDAGIFEF
ncbi:hypothetical protein ACQE3D_10655 [Methylomonas sp. MS20]|uniref:hypothetical protein n=1 Tax=unclassified Methylomonas TaxID=2608980 RepID=UPI0028A2DEA5|nr:hypothetical protein [Methylomonas sp. MV1]MDT4328543.1 hypothetical protein [Methylomonas sp. MV1]